jgi:signal transduction histidine kinase
MESTRWWSIAVVGTTAVLASILALSGPSLLQALVGFGAMVAFVACWFAFGRVCGRDSAGSILFSIVTSLFAGSVAFANPTLAIVQCIAFPLVWTRIESTRVAIVANFGVAASVGFGLYLSSGADEAALVQSLVIEALSLAFSISLGLWITRITVLSIERQRLLDELQTAQSALASMSRDAGVTSERERLAREIHDTIAQDLTGIVLLAQRVRRELGAGSLAAADEQLDLLEDGARTALAETRALVASTAPPALDAGGIGAALERLGARFERETGMRIEVTVTLERALERDLEVVLLRCAQEGLANVRKHSGAQSVALELIARPDRISLRVSDNGSGFDPEQRHGGYGLAGMRDRLALVAGSLDIETGEEGTTLLVTLPTEVTA